MKTGAIEAMIKRYKYEGRLGWATIFGRLIVGYLSAMREPGEVDLVVANPTYPPDVAGHTERVLDAAAREDVLGSWCWDTANPRALIKVAATPRSAGQTKTYDQAIRAADALAEVLVIPDRTRTAGRRILVYDDICTTGLQLDRVARVLKQAGHASHVEGLVLARTPWRPSS